MTQSHRIDIRFDNCLASEALILANDLEQDIREAAASVEVSRLKDRPDSQDFGATLVLVFGTPVAVILARAIGNFLQRHSGASITITKEGAVVATNVDSKDVARIAEAFRPQGPR
ncbi:hypothetical protein [Bradyrhizobium sp. USDA 4353]